MLPTTHYALQLQVTTIAVKNTSHYYGTKKITRHDYNVTS